MGTFSRILKFTLGSAFGAAVGAVVASAMAPQSGDELQQGVRELVSQAQEEGDAARAETIQNLTERFRAKTHDNGAFTTEREQRYAARR